MSSLQLDVGSCPTLSYRYRENKVDEFKAQHPYNKNLELIEWSLYTIICGREQSPSQLKEDTRVARYTAERHWFVTILSRSWFMGVFICVLGYLNWDFGVWLVWLKVWLKSQG